MRILLLVSTLTVGLASSAAFAAAGDYIFRVKGGPSFELQDWENQARIAGEFDYDFGYSMGFNLFTGFGISDNFRFDLIPSFRYSYLYLGPASMYGTAGMGYTVLDTENAFGMRFGTGLSMPMGDHFEFNTDVNLFVVPAGVPGTPVTLDWFLGFGFRFQ
jgi:opacity protein-like surface antigen